LNSEIKNNKNGVIKKDFKIPQILIRLTPSSPLHGNGEGKFPSPVLWGRVRDGAHSFYAIIHICKKVKMNTKLTQAILQIDIWRVLLQFPAKVSAVCG
jgi:hypothetical protein